MLGKLTCVPVRSDQLPARTHWQDHKAHGKPEFWKSWLQNAF
jgi:hypothetical protein